MDLTGQERTRQRISSLNFYPALHHDQSLRLLAVSPGSPRCNCSTDSSRIPAVQQREFLYIDRSGPPSDIALNIKSRDHLIPTRIFHRRLASTTHPDQK